MSHLWEHDHPYYSADNNFFSNDYHATCESWVEYTELGAPDLDMDLNLLFRWDWIRPRDSEYFEEGEDEDERLELFFVYQRKGIYAHHTVTVTAADEPAVRAYLEQRWAHMFLLWQPIAAGEPGATP